MRFYKLHKPGQMYGRPSKLLLHQRLVLIYQNVFIIEIII